MNEYTEELLAENNKLLKQIADTLTQINNKLNVSNILNEEKVSIDEIEELVKRAKGINYSNIYLNESKSEGADTFIVDENEIQGKE